MKYSPEIHHRRSIRLKGYDYSQAGAYFVTICTQSRECLFGEIVDGGMRLNSAGDITCQCWDDIPTHFPHVDLDAFVVMPNHVHGIVVITDVGANDVVGAKNFSPQNFSPLQSRPSQSSPFPPPQHGISRTIGSIVRGFKIGVTK